MKLQIGGIRTARIAAVVSFALAIVIGFLGANSPAIAGVPSVLPSAAKPASAASKIDQAVLQDTANGKSASFIILMADQANVTAGYSMRDQNARGWYVYSTLSQHAERSQADIKAALRAQGISYQSFWVANMLVVSGNRSLVDAMAARPDVGKIEANRSFKGIDDPIAAADAVPSNDAPNTVEWGVQNVNAPQVWAMGYTGQGIVIGNGDTGMRWSHNALKPHSRGWNGTTADHNYNWHDSIHTGGGSCGANSQFPCDDYGHGTHTTGTTSGDDGAGNQVGVAPGAKWIGCRNMDQGNGMPSTYTECFQFFMAPTDLSGNNPNPALRPHVENNSWGCPTSEGCAATTLQTIVENSQAAGILIEASAGNSGSGCSTVSDPPAIYGAAFSTGATDISNNLAGFSSRGPVTADGSNRLKPNISAPGVNVRSSTSGSDASYGNSSGTSMAGPHVVGVVALLWSAHPELSRMITETKNLLQNTANPAVNVSPVQTCGGIPSSTIPNNSFGYGRADALAAVNGAGPTPSPTATPVCPPSFQGIQITGFAYNPPSVTVYLGATVRWTNFDAITHTATSDVPGIFDSGDLGQNGFYQHVFNTAGTFPYHCTYHANMLGSIVVAAVCPPVLTPTVTLTSTRTPTRTPTTGGLTNTPTPTSCAGAGWTPGPAFPSPVVRNDGVWVAAQNRFYSIGGRSADTAGTGIRNPQYYTPGGGWAASAAAMVDDQTSNVAAALLTGPSGPRIYIVGGSAGGGTTASNRVQVFDFVADTMTELTTDPWPAPPIGAIVPGGRAVYNNKLYMIGGFNINVGMINQIWEFDPMAAAGSRWHQKTAVLPTPLGYVPAETIGNKIYTAGGSEWDGTTLIDSVHTYIYDPVADTICDTCIPELPTMTAETHAVVQAGEIWVLGGGRVAPNPSNIVQIYNPGTNTWRAGTPFALARRNFAAAVNPGVAVYLVGGYQTAAATQSMEIFSKGCGTPPPPTPSHTPIGFTFTPTRTNTATNTPSGPTNTPTVTNTRTNTPTGPTRTPTLTSTPCAIPFTDVHATDYFFPGVTWLYCKGAISGYGSVFLPYNNTTRGQLTKIVTLAYDTPQYTPPIPTFRDVPPTHTFYVYIETAYHQNIVSGYTCGVACLEFRPEANVTRAQLAKIIVTAAGWELISPVTPTFRDVPTNHFFYEYIETAVCHQVVTGYSCGTGCLEYRPDASATRGQIAKMVHNAVSNLGCPPALGAGK